MYLKITDLGPISKADIKISKINVIGGVNSSGKSMVSKLLYCHLKSNIKNQPLDLLLKEENIDIFKSSSVEFEMGQNFDEIFYMDNIPLFDLTDLNFLETGHIRHLRKALEMPQGNYNTEVINKIDEIIEGECSDISSNGFKQIGVIEKLLKSNCLKKNSFLIIDEPENCLHPQWQIKFAQILVILASELNIHLYLNSHSPMFIEAISLYAQYYNLIAQTSFYLTQKTENKFFFKKISPKNMGEVYENLTRPYDDLDRLKAKILLRSNKNGTDWR